MKTVTAFAVTILVSISPLLADQDSTAKNEEISISTALHAFYSEYGYYPSGTTIEIIHALTGANPKKNVFIQFNPKGLQRDGSILDPWGTPYHITRPDSDFVDIRSAGPDKIFDSKDDIAIKTSQFTSFLNPWDHHDEFKPAPGQTIEHQKAADITRIELRMLDNAMDQFAIENAKITGAEAKPEDLLKYVPKGTRLYDALGDPKGPKDVMGNSYGPFIVDQIPKVSPLTFKALSDVAKHEFWEPYIEKQNH